MSKVNGKRVLLRLDLNISDKSNDKDLRLVSVLKTIHELIEMGAKQIVIISHYGRPPLPLMDCHYEDFSLYPVSILLSKMLDMHVHFIRHITQMKDALDAINQSKIVMLENLRFNEAEEQNSKEFAKILATWGDVYVNDAFSCSHRKHASIDAITLFLPSYMGRLMEKELFYLDKLIGGNVSGNKIAVIGGLKVSTKCQVLKNLAKNVDTLIIGGAMANTFLHAIGYDVGASFVEHSMIAEAREIYDAFGNKIILPNDAICIVNDEVVYSCMGDVPKDARIYDVGEKSVEIFKNALDKAGYIVYNGTMGKYEEPRFANSSNEIASFIAERTARDNVISVVGGGDTILSILNYDSLLLSKFSHASTAGGAMLSWLENFSLDVVDNLKKNGVYYQ